MRILFFASALLIPLACLATDLGTARFLSEKSSRLAEQKRYDEAFSEIGWLLGDQSPTIRSYAKKVIEKYPDIMVFRIRKISSENELKVLTCENGNKEKAKEKSFKLIEELRNLADQTMIEQANEKIEEFYSNFEITSDACELAKDSLEKNKQEEKNIWIMRATAQAPLEIQALSTEDFCVQYGMILRKDIPEKYSSVDGILRIFDSEAKKRKLKLEKSLVISRVIKIGIDQCDLYASWGRPMDKNRSVGSWGVHYQYIYGQFGPYVYTKNNRVVSWQD